MYKIQFKIAIRVWVAPAVCSASQCQWQHVIRAWHMFCLNCFTTTDLSAWILNTLRTKCFGINHNQILFPAKKNTDILSFEVFILATETLAICCNTIWSSNYNFITYLPTQFSILRVTYDLTDPHSGVTYLNPPRQQIFIWFSISIAIWRIT